MSAEALSGLGAGVLLGWALLPWFAALAKRSRDAAPAAYHRALAFALLVPPLLLLVPVSKLALGALVAHAATPVALPGRVLLAWAEPILASPARAALGVPFGRVLDAVGALWLLVFVLGVAQLVVARVGLGRRLRAAGPAPEAVRTRALQISKRFGIRLPAIRVSPGFPAPFASGFCSPVIGLDPHSSMLGPVELGYALEHELSHIARGDTRLAFFAELARCCFIGHPSARWLLAELGWAREAAVDASVAGDNPRGYAQFLIAAAERWGLARAASTSSVFMADTALARRIEMLTSSSGQIHAAPRRLALLGASALGLGLAALAPASCGSPQVGAGPARVRAELGGVAVGGDGQLPIEDIQKVVLESLPAFERCYTELPAPRDKTGFDMHFVIGADGRVSSGHVDSQPFVELGECGARVMRGLRFPAPEGGAINVSYPLAFEDAPGAAGSGPTMAPPGSPGGLMSGRTAVSGRLPPDVIRAVMREQFGRFRECYEALPEPRPVVGAKLHFTIGAAGSIATGHVDSEASPALGQCLERVLLAVHFPAPADGEVTVGYPVIFAPD